MNDVIPVSSSEIKPDHTIVWSYLGRVEYPDALSLMEKLVHRVKKVEMSGMLLFLEHPPIITLGKRADMNDIIAPRESLKRRGYRVFNTDRGGKATCHGPGQLIGYVILNLVKLGVGVKKLVENIEAALVKSLAAWQVSATRMGGRPGVWVQDKKIAAIGMRVKDHVTDHGFALNLNYELRSFDLIVPCGARGAKATNLSEHTAVLPAPYEAARVIAGNIERVFGIEISEIENETEDGGWHWQSTKCLPVSSIQEDSHGQALLRPCHPSTPQERRSGINDH